MPLFAVLYFPRTRPLERTGKSCGRGRRTQREEEAPEEAAEESPGSLEELAVSEEACEEAGEEPDPPEEAEELEAPELPEEPDESPAERISPWPSNSVRTITSLTAVSYTHL